MSIFSVIVTVYRGPGAQGIYSTHGTKKNPMSVYARFTYTWKVPFYLNG